MFLFRFISLTLLFTNYDFTHNTHLQQTFTNQKTENFRSFWELAKSQNDGHLENLLHKTLASLREAQNFTSFGKWLSQKNKGYLKILLHKVLTFLLKFKNFTSFVK